MTFCIADIVTVRTIAREPVLPELPRIPEVPDRTGIRRLPSLPPILEATALPQVPNVSRSDLEASRAPSAREVSTGDYQSRISAASCDGRHQGLGRVA